MITKEPYQQTVETTVMKVDFLILYKYTCPDTLLIYSIKYILRNCQGPFLENTCTIEKSKHYHSFGNSLVVPIQDWYRKKKTRLLDISLRFVVQDDTPYEVADRVFSTVGDYEI